MKKLTILLIPIFAINNKANASLTIKHVTIVDALAIKHTKNGSSEYINVSKTVYNNCKKQIIKYRDYICKLKSNLEWLELEDKKDGADLSLFVIWKCIKSDYTFHTMGKMSVDTTIFNSTILVTKSNNTQFIYCNPNK